MTLERPIRRNWLLMELSTLLFVLGSLLIYRCTGPEIDLMFTLGVASLALATALFRAGRARLLEGLEQLWKTRGLSEERARGRAIEYVDRLLLAEPLPLEATDGAAALAAQRAAEYRWPHPLLIS